VAGTTGSVSNFGSSRHGTTMAIQNDSAGTGAYMYNNAGEGFTASSEIPFA
jgi:hypothetical protein